MPTWCAFPLSIPYWTPSDTCLPGSQPTAAPTNPYFLVPGIGPPAASAGVSPNNVVPQLQGLPASVGNIADWLGGVNAQDHWKGIGLLAAGVMVAIFGFIMFTGTGKATVNIAKSAAT